MRFFEGARIYHRADETWVGTVTEPATESHDTRRWYVVWDHLLGGPYDPWAECALALLSPLEQLAGCAE